MKIWYSIYNRKAYVGPEPAFYNSDDFNWTNVLESNWLEIKDELYTYLSSNHRLTPYFNQRMVNNPNSWKTIPLMTWGVEFHNNLSNFSHTSTILKKIPGLVSASFNLLEKKSEIKSHFGDTNAIVRVHLGLSIPDKLPEVGLKVNGISRSWEEGKVLMFCDGYEHSAWNYSNEDRYILLLDVIRPEFMHKKKLICGTVLGSLFLQSMGKKLSFLVYLLFFPIYILHFFAKISAIILTPVYNFSSRIKAKK